MDGGIVAEGKGELVGRVDLRVVAQQMYNPLQRLLPQEDFITDEQVLVDRCGEGAE